jgi:hypothetical protein
MLTITGHGEVHLHNLQFNGILVFTQSMQGSFLRKSSMKVVKPLLSCTQKNKILMSPSAPPPLPSLKKTIVHF